MVLDVGLHRQQALSRHQVGWRSWRIPIVMSMGRGQRWQMRWFMPCHC